MRHNSVIIDSTLGFIRFPQLTMQFKSTASELSVNPQAIFIDDVLTIPSMTTKTITAFVDHLSEWNTTDTVTSVENIAEAGNLIIYHSISTIFDKKIAVRVTNRTESPDSIKKNKEIAEFPLVTPEQSKFIKPVDRAIISTIPEGDPDLITYLTELLRSKEPEQQIKTFWFPTLKNLGSTEDYTPILTQILKREMKIKPKRYCRISNEISRDFKFLFSRSKITENKVAVRVTDATESPYTIRKHSQITEFSVVTLGQSKFVRPVDTAILSMITKHDLDLTTHLNEQLRKNKPEQQKKAVWFPTSETLGKDEDHTTIQTGILEDLIEVKEKKMNPKNNAESRKEFREIFDWTDTLLTRFEKQAVEDIFLEYHDKFARHRMDTGMNTEFKVKLTQKMTKLFTAKACQCQSN